MADSKLSALTELTTPANGDFLYVLDVSDTTDGASGSSKKITRSNLFSGLISGSYVDTGSVQSITGEKTFDHLTFTSGTTSANGIAFGSDVNLYRSAAHTLKTDDKVYAGLGVDFETTIRSYSTGTTGELLLSGASSGAYDVNLYASAANVLKTDDTLHIVGDLVVDPAGAATKKITLGVVGSLEQSSGMRVALAQDFPFYIQGEAATTGGLFGVQDNSANSFFTIDQTNGVVVNDAGATTNFRVESDGDANNIFSDGTNNKVGIGTNSPAEKLSVAGNTTVTGTEAVATGTAATAGGAAAIKIGTSNVVGIYFGSGAPTVSAPKGSLYLRTDGSSTNDRAYINTNGSTTWTYLTTGA